MDIAGRGRRFPWPLARDQERVFEIRTHR
jgi:hypothetical protein